jgi:hypothetical protein
MSIPLDRLYHYIETIANKIRGNDVIIYRFYPHGSKKLEDLQLLRDYADVKKIVTSQQIFCHDQEPLAFDFYKSVDLHHTFPSDYSKEYANALTDLGVNWSDYNIRSVPGGPISIYDQCILLHSERRSVNADRYEQHGFVPVYYWNHALLALDWYRYAQHLTFTKQTNQTLFLIYNRAWSGTREYRLKFADLLVENKLLDFCQTSIGFVDNNINYKDHQFVNPLWKPIHQLDYYFNNNSTSSCYSADFNVDDYRSTDVEVILETLFDDSRLHLTEKTLRPIACGQPFILCATKGSLEYLRSYGFQTFNKVFDESYDNYNDPMERLTAIIKLMKEIASWTESERMIKIQLLQQIAEYNQQYFFSKDFFNKITNELHSNLQTGITLVENTNTGQRFLNERKLRSTNLSIKKLMTNNQVTKSRVDTAFIVSTARKYYNRYLNTLNK